MAASAPPAWVPLAVGAGVAGLMLVTGWGTGSICRRDCHRVYDLQTGSALFNNKILLTAVGCGADGAPERYGARVVLENGHNYEISTHEAVDFTWGGATTLVDVQDGLEPPVVRVARKPGGGGVYLPSYRDGKSRNNLAVLPRLPWPVARQPSQRSRYLPFNRPLDAPDGLRRVSPLMSRRRARTRTLDEQQGPSRGSLRVLLTREAVA